jgi:transposase
VEKDWLEARLRAGRSIESIAAEVDRDPSTVAYWVNKHGLVSRHASKHAPTGGIEREVLEALLAEGLSLRAMAERLGMSYTTVRHWLKKFGLQTQRGRRLELSRRAREEGALEVSLECPRHGVSLHRRRADYQSFRCLACRSEAVLAARRRIKTILVAEAGGRCAKCGYDRDVRALHFHHRDPETKAFAISRQGMTFSLESAREEAAKCDLVCANCHAEIETALAGLVFPDADPDPG